MFKKLTDDAKLPCRSTRHSAGFDVFSNEDVVIGAGCTELIGLGIAIDLEQIEWLFYKGDIQKKENGKYHKTERLDNNLMNKFLSQHYLELHIRSSLRVKGLTSLGTGIIDIDYPDEIKIVVHNPITLNGYNINNDGCLCPPNSSGLDYTINKGDKIGQCTLKEHKGFLLGIESDAERVSGFGSTGM